jgi:hypothetical protein
MSYLWVVEIFTWRWEPTVGVALNKRDGLYEAKLWRSNNPGSKFRLVRYSPEPPK